MIGRPVALSLLLVGFLASSCVSQSAESGGSLTWKDSGPGAETADRPRPPRERPASSTRRIVEVPETVMNELMAFVNGSRYLLADRIEVDASRIPFQMAMVPVADPGFVDTLEMTAPGLNATGILLRARNERPSVERDFPRLRIGDGVDLVGGREIQVRTWNRVDERRPIFLEVQGVGHAVYTDAVTGERIERDAITLRAEVVVGPDGPVFVTDVR